MVWYNYWSDFLTRKNKRFRWHCSSTKSQIWSQEYARKADQKMPELRFHTVFLRSDIAGLEIACCISEMGIVCWEIKISYAVASGMHFSENSAFFIIMGTGLRYYNCGSGLGWQWIYIELFCELQVMKHHYHGVQHTMVEVALDRRRPLASWGWTGRHFITSIVWKVLCLSIFNAYWQMLRLYDHAGNPICGFYSQDHRSKACTTAQAQQYRQHHRKSRA